MNLADCTIHVRIDASCQILPEKIEVFTGILRESLSFVLPSGIECLEKILVVPDGELEQVVNTLLLEEAKTPGLYREGMTPPLAVAVPVEDGSGLRCFIVVRESLLQSVNVEEESADVVSTLLEELFHVRLYTITLECVNDFETTLGRI